MFCFRFFGGIEQHVAQATNIAFFVPAALVSILLNFKSGIIKWKIAIPIIAFGIIGAVIGAKIALVLDTTSLKKFFGIFLGIIAFYEILSLIKLYKKDNLSNNKNIKKN